MCIEEAIIYFNEIFLSDRAGGIIYSLKVQLAMKKSFGGQRSATAKPSPPMLVPYLKDMDKTEIY